MLEGGLVWHGAEQSVDRSIERGPLTRDAPPAGPSRPPANRRVALRPSDARNRDEFAEIASAKRLAFDQVETLKE